MLLLESGFVLIIVISRIGQVKKEIRLKEHIYYTIGHEQRSTRPVENNPSLVTLTHYVNLPLVETQTQPVDIPTNTTSTTKQQRSDTITNSAYSAGIHYDCIPGEPMPTTAAGESKASPASEHLYSVIKDEMSTTKKQTHTQATETGAHMKPPKQPPEQQYQDQQDQYRSEPLGGRIGTRTSADNYVNQPVELQSEAFMELMPGNLEAYDTLKRDQHEEIPEVSLLMTSGPYDKLLSPDEDPLDLTAAKFNPYGQLSDEYLNDTEIPIIDTEFNPYDDIVGVSSQHPSLQVSANCSATVSNNDLATSRQKHSETNPHQTDAEIETLHAYDAIDELQKQIHILSQSIPTLDFYGYEDLEKIAPAPKASRSIPMLDSAGYEDLDTVKPQQMVPHSKRQLTKTKDVSFGLKPPPYDDYLAGKRKERHSIAGITDSGEHPPLIPPRTIESMYTAVQKKPRSSTITQAAAAATTSGGKENPTLDERHMTTGNRPQRSLSTNDFLDSLPRPVPSTEALYTAVNKPKKNSEGAPPIPPKTDTETNSPVFPPKSVDSLYTAVSKKPKATKTDVDDATGGEVPPPRPPKTLEEHYLAVQGEGTIPPLPPRTVERLYSGVYRHKEMKQTEL